VLHGFIDTHGSFAPIDPPGSMFTAVSGINRAGQIEVDPENWTGC
jgi:hypothetical protein